MNTLNSPWGKRYSEWTEEEKQAERDWVANQAVLVKFNGGMQRSSATGKINYLLTRDGPMYERWAVHLSKGAWEHNPRNWMLAAGQEELERFRESFSRHSEQWLRGDTDEDHAAAIIFNLNGAEYVKDRLGTP
jgi:hypothetical protein